MISEQVSYYNKKIDKHIRLINEARRSWDLFEDPGIGVHSFGDFDLLVTKHEAQSKKSDDYIEYVLYYEEESICMSRDWDRFFENMTRQTREGDKKMEKKSMKDDDDTRDRIRLKCKNDWDLDLSEDQISICIIEMEETGLSIFHNQLWPNERTFKKKDSNNNWTKKKRITWDKTIDGYRAIAARTGLFGGVDSPEFREEKGEDGSSDLVARVTVYRIGPNGKRNPYVGEARFGEFVQMIDVWKDGKRTGKKVPNHIWSESPKNQLAVAAERQALRKAFQACEDDQTAVPTDDRHKPSDKPPSDPDRGKPVNEKPSDKKLDKVVEDKPKEKKEESKGKYVGVPQSGFKLHSKYNKDERIILLVRQEEQKRTALALDSGYMVCVSDDGYEIIRKERSDESKGGKEWNVGDEYFDGSKIYKIASSKKDPNAIRLLLDSGFEVRLDRWGKEERRKERKVEKEEKPKEDVKEKENPKNKNEPDKTQGETEPTEAKATVADEKADIESIKSIEMLRKVTLPLLKDWCENVLRRKISPKAAYTELTGVILQKGQTMGLDDYKVLYQSLEEAIEEAS